MHCRLSLKDSKNRKDRKEGPKAIKGETPYRSILKGVSGEEKKLLCLSYDYFNPICIPPLNNYSLSINFKHLLGIVTENPGTVFPCTEYFLPFFAY